MKAITQFIQSHEKQLLAVVLILGIYALARLPNLPESERKQLASHFKFTKQALPEVAGHPRKSFRAVHPSLEHFASWISSVGASVALNDLDSDGLPNDVCYVDPRTDLVIVGPAPGTPARYKPFTLNPAPLQFNPETMAPMGCLPGDFNEDGLVDVMVYYWGRTPVIFLRKIISESGGTAALAASQYTACELVDGVERWYTNAATQADLDGDGHLDLIIGNYFPDGSRILDARASGTERMQHSMSRASNGGRSHMLLSTGVTNEPTPVPHYKDVDAFPNGDIAHGWTLGVGAADLDGDLLPELYFANDFGSDRLLHNLSTPG
ncbi:MAG TPA: VCBS repeat-containing protein, partial [Blastocatellia bacterium]